MNFWNFSKKCNSSENSRTVPKKQNFIHWTELYTILIPRLRSRLYILIHASPISIHWVDFRFHILIHASPILIQRVDFRLHIIKHASPILIHWIGFRISAPNPNTCITYLNTLSRLLLHWQLGSTRVVSQSETIITSLESSLRHTRELSALSDPSRLWAPLGSL